MPGEVETANWRVLFEELPKAINQLESHDAHHSLEAALCLRMALDVLRCGGSLEVYDQLIFGMSKIAETGTSRRSLPRDTCWLLECFADDFAEWQCQDRDAELVARLSELPVTAD
ncbi:hypothetical protein NYR54_00970 [Chelativorans sp. SCAU2101]|uniref:Uncharacterized protein n=1 Tax=Chelativorans petroleitrophicus TaxID=2975484 RepID=A0A9X2X5P4_9HYPH|nr:hypothetical protein [Chelativorans petroleitrophicus]MCT8988869.1 hypothetical protein [Chelativorans petroleitrophicus]